jgi:hypothetical protein
VADETSTACVNFVSLNVETDHAHHFKEQAESYESRQQKARRLFKATG